MFKKLTAIEPISMTENWIEEIKKRAGTCVFFDSLPKDNNEIIARIVDSDAVLVSWTTRIDKEVIEACPNIRYIGMCCSLYAPESANVDILAAGERGITVLGVRDYGDEGVPEYVVSELVRLLHGFGEHMWKDEPHELTNLPIGILGMGTTGQFVARALRFFGADVSYYSRTRKPAIEEEMGYTYRALDDLLSHAQIIVTCLNKNAILLHEREFALWGDQKILVNISIGPSFDIDAAKMWLLHAGNFLLADTKAALGGETLYGVDNVICPNKGAGASTLTRDRLGKKVVENMDTFLQGK